MSRIDKKREHPAKRKKEQIKEYKISKCQLKGAQFLHLVCQGGWFPPCPPVSYATVQWPIFPNPNCFKIVDDFDVFPN